MDGGTNSFGPKSSCCKHWELMVLLTLPFWGMESQVIKNWLALRITVVFPAKLDSPVFGSWRHVHHVLKLIALLRQGVNNLF